LRLPGFGILEGMLAPLKALVSPRRYFDQLRELLRRYGIYINAVIFFGAWIASSITAFTLILLVEAARSTASLSVTGILLAPARALTYSIIFPVIPAVLDTILIMIGIAPFDRERPLYDVIAVRASSLLPYTLRVVLLEVRGALTLKSLISTTMTPESLGLLALGALLTILGLRRTMRVSWPGAVIGGLLPLSYKIILGLS